MRNPHPEGNRPTRRTFLAAAAALPWSRPDHLTVGEVRFLAIRRGKSNRRYFHVHGNEHTAREVLAAHMQTATGTAWLVENQQRNIRVMGGLVDPNRMFSKEGALKSVRRLNPLWGEARVQDAVDLLLKQTRPLIRELMPPDGGVLIALHNNSAGYSVRSEVPISDRTSLPDEVNPHEFFLCTSPADFEKISAGPYNVVLQQKAPPSDDGSLSRLCASRGVRYVNLEASLGKTERQREMLEWLEARL
jgi:hypothetical protein